MSILMVLLLAGIAGYSQAEAKASDPWGAKIENIDMHQEVDRKLVAFCQGAILRERGLACSPLAGSSDNWILEHLLPDQGFLEALDKCGEFPAFSAGKPVKDHADKNVRPRHRTDDVIALYQRTNATSDKLRAALTAEQLKRLPGVYLHVEGLLALCRPEYAGLFEDADSPAKIRELGEQVWSQEASPVHRALFGLQSLDEAPSLELELRRISFVLDLRILAMLKPAERSKLAKFVHGTLPLLRIAHGAPAY
jgi:hypothetical protein